ncbi:PspC domain-containing protein [Anaerobacillus sp. MEB173]|uniref:PspC domain-containing protein n=1 Tax=Anaerobacillus sp. MEB173 TaxID=3383345 RepID=UPI003F9348CF
MKRLYRTQYERKVAGVCGGLARYFNIDPTIVRVIVIVLSFLTSFIPVIIAYIAGIFVMPNEKDLLE